MFNISFKLAIYVINIKNKSLDGIITTFSVIVGCYGSNLGLNVIIIFGVSTMMADAISMAFGDYLSTKSELEFFKT